ncbi:MAG: hypothetical protein KIB08_04515 [Negativicoccus succinicivorans]|uniref:hypothetical protein n=1 Tax=Negativicoccus succinicivorans TaxID=620903 RepID=UPI0026F0C233|nr:hypothetical protein [Negativicoccus succinicivorans]MBS5887765.1 hypothetical protein [Negativicoccus succinicivorans]
MISAGAATVIAKQEACGQELRAAREFGPYYVFDYVEELDIPAIYINKITGESVCLTPEKICKIIAELERRAN